MALLSLKMYCISLGYTALSVEQEGSGVLAGGRPSETRDLLSTVLWLRKKPEIETALYLTTLGMVASLVPT